MRAQLLDAGVDHLDGVLYTHAHADHLHGIDDLRAFWMKTKRRLDVYADDATSARILEAFGYCFRTPPGGSYPPILTMNRIDARRAVLDRRRRRPDRRSRRSPRPMVPAARSLGFRFGGAGIFLRCQRAGRPVPRRHSRDWTSGSSMRFGASRIRATSASREALAWIERLKPRRAILTHMHYSLDYATLRAELPPNVEPAYDGMVIAL